MAVLKSRVKVSLAAVAAAVVVLAASASPASAAGDELKFRFGAPTRTVLDTGAPGTSIGDMTITTGDVLDWKTGKKVGYYTTNQITVRADVAAGREIRKVDLSIALRDGKIFATSLIRAATGKPPTAHMEFALTGGIGAYDGIAGTLMHDAVAGVPTFNVTIKPL
jgi:hypothetical protein